MLRKDRPLLPAQFSRPRLDSPLDDGEAPSQRVPRMVENLTQIWQRVLQRPHIAVDDNFFHIGGSFESADQLFAEITKEFGQELPSATIYHAQTIAALAALLERPSLPQFSPVVQVKAGSQQPPVLIVHGMAGTVPFFELARNIRTAHPVYGLEAMGLDGLAEPQERVEDMAQFYLNSMQDLQPHGPYILIGYSFGGLVALEMAQRLAGRGQEIGLLVLVDAYPHLRYLAPSQRVKLIAQRAQRILFEIDERLIRASRRARSRFSRAVTHHLGNRLAVPSRLCFEQTTRRVRESAYRALEAYQPQFYGGKIKFVKSGSDSYYPSDPVAVWANLAAEFESETVPGGHLNMLTSDDPSLAAVLTRYLNEAPGEEYELAGTGFEGADLDAPI
jgi:acetoacetyl-CoA synthetase